MRVPEIIAVITGILSVWYARKESILVYPVGIVSVLLYVYICLRVGLYADAGINLYYFMVSVYGWYYWKKGGKLQRMEIAKEEKAPVSIDSIFNVEEKRTDNKDEAVITMNTFSENIYCMFAIGVSGFVVSYILDNYTNSNVPYWDGFTTAIFMVAMWLMAKKKIENWVLWVLGDAACIPLFLYKGLCLSSLQYAVFTVLAIMGFRSWYLKLAKNYSR